jgi:hypothetical protein
VNKELGVREENQEKSVPDNDKGNILNFNMSLALASPHCKINWLTCSNVVFTILTTKLRKLGNSVASRVGELVIIIGV